MNLFFVLIANKIFSSKMFRIGSISYTKENVNLILSNGTKFDAIVFAKHPFCCINNKRLWEVGCLDDIWESNEWGQNNLLKYTLWMSWTNKWSSTGSLVSGLHEFLETISIAHSIAIECHCSYKLALCVYRHNAYMIRCRNDWRSAVAMCMYFDDCVYFHIEIPLTTLACSMIVCVPIGT